MASFDELGLYSGGRAKVRRRPEFDGGPMGTPTTPDTGGDPAPGPPATPPPAPAPRPTFRIQPVDTGKFNDPTHKTAKYDFLRTGQYYDPTKGIQSGMLDDLNKFGYADFYGSGQKLGYRNVTAAGRTAGLTGDFEGDFIQNWGNGSNPNAQWAWNWADPNPGGQTNDSTLNSLLAAFSGGSSAQSSSGSDGTMAAILNLVASMQPASTSSATAPAASNYTINVPESAPAPTFSGGYVPPTINESSGMEQAIRTLAMRMPELTGGGQSGDDLMQMISRLVGVRA